MSLSPHPHTDSQGIDGEALDWFVRRTGGGFDTREEALFQAWLDADSAHRAAYDRQQSEWTALDQLPSNGLAILRANLADDLATEAATVASTKVAQAPRDRSWIRTASTAVPTRRRFLVPAFSAAAIALMAGGAGMLIWSHDQAQPVFAQTFSTQRGQQLEVPLPDGSRLRLDTATRVEVGYYRDRREVKLPEGQAVFSVQGDAARPFEVLAGPLRITVVGTRFSVRHTPGTAGDDGVRVAVEEGRVKVERIAPDGTVEAASAPVLLSAGQQVASDAHGTLAPVTPLSAGGIAPWRDNRVSFDNTRLDQVLAELERYGNTRLVLRDPAVAGLRLTGTFNPSRLDNFVKVLPQAAPVRLQESGDQLEIVRAP
ncbi:FecR domain-containing protein [Hydrogenophaga sp. 2FB]|uniref:FecR family protein n=1 Tax=Hydrogenophaga sp. 2FB TaxID=2502187 RepID=UPI0014858FD7|nr:FecR domain-containing protein [Hydrogenophaga sp. 2FB]